MHVQDKILEFLKNIGPTLPSKVAKNIKTEILIASAHLSDLSTQGKIRISNLKVGGSPLYYLPGQEAQLYPFAAGNINAKDLRVLERLKTEKVLQEENLDLLSKVALRALRDFATPLHVNFNGKRQLFWKWHLLPPEETNKMIGAVLRGSQSLIQKAETTVTPDITPPLTQRKVEISQDDVKQEIKQQEIKKEVVSEVESKGENLVLLQEEKNISPSESKITSDYNKEDTQKKLEPTKKEEKIKTETEEVKAKEKETIEEIKSVETKSNENVEKIEKKKETKKVETVEQEVEEIKKEEVENKKPLIKKVKDKLIRKKKFIPDTFLPDIKDFFVKLEITMKRQETVRKNAEMNFFVDVRSVVGTMNYFCKAKRKNKCDEKDLSAAYVEAQMKKLPLLFLYTDQITKKAQKMLDSGTFENVIVKKIE